MRILFFGDIVGAIGRQAIAAVLPRWKESQTPDFIIANVENLSHGRGISAKCLLELDELGIDAYTSGNHVWENAAGLSCFNDPRWASRLIRPSNMRPGNVGNGWTLIEKNSMRILLINLLGSLFMKDESSSSFLALDAILGEVPAFDIAIVDIHAETTSEKEALGHYADGRVTAMLGTHTHVPTADQKILPGGTAYVTDVGRNGGYDSVVGFEKTAAISRFLDPQQRAYDPQASGLAEVNAVCIDIDPNTGKAFRIERLREIVDI